ncbi:ATP-binding protein [Streptomyces sp. NPDC003691]
MSLPGLAELRALPRRLVLTLPSTGQSVRTARETAEQALVEWGIGLRHPVADPALLILAELVANSVRHAAALSPTLTVILGAGPDTFALAVHDRHPDRPDLQNRNRNAARGARTGPDRDTGPDSGRGRDTGPAAGRGLATVMELTLGLGGTASVLGDPRHGKTVWIALPL